MSAARRRLRMVEVENYTFTGPDGPVTLVDLFGDRTCYGRQQDWEDSPEGWPQYPTYG